MSIKKHPIDTTGWKEFVVGDLFEYSRGKEKSPNKVPNGKINFVKESIFNNGVVPNKAPSKVFDGNALTVSINNAQAVFYQKDSFGASVNIVILTNKKLNEKNGLFIAASLSKMHKAKYNYNSKISKDKLLNEKILLPATSEGEVDWQWIEDFMDKAIERNRKWLHMMKNIKPKKHPIDTSGWKEFKLGDMFTSENGKTDIRKKDLIKKSSDNIPVLSSGFKDFGIIGQTELNAKIHESNTITVDMFGNVFYRNFRYKMVTHARIFSLKAQDFSLNELRGLFLQTCLKKELREFCYNNMCSFKKIKDKVILLPATSEGEIDWQYIEKFMTKIIEENKTRLTLLNEYFGE